MSLINHVSGLGTYMALDSCNAKHVNCTFVGNRNFDISLCVLKEFFLITMCLTAALNFFLHNLEKLELPQPEQINIFFFHIVMFTVSKVYFIITSPKSSLWATNEEK